MPNFAVFVSGRGSNFKSILESIKEDSDAIKIKALFSDKENCGAVNIAIAHNTPVFLLSKTSQKGWTAFSELTAKLKELEIDFIVLAGFLKKIPDDVVDVFNNRIINIHPALLPSFGGKGMYGMNVHNAVFKSSAKISGATAHFVDKIYDNGKIIAQKCVDISDVRSPEEIAERVLKVEHELLPYVVKKLAHNKIIIDNERTYLID